MSIENDPAWPRARDAAQAYAVQDRGGMYQEDDGSEFWKPNRTEQGDRYLQELGEARWELAKRHDGRAIDNAIFAEAERAGLTDGYEPGTDVDGYTFYEPEGNPRTQMRQIFEQQDADLKYRSVSTEDLRVLIRAREERYLDEGLGDNFSTMAKIRREIGQLNRIVERREAELHERSRSWEADRHQRERLERPDRGTERDGLEL